MGNLSLKIMAEGRFFGVMLNHLFYFFDGKSELLSNSSGRVLIPQFDFIMRVLTPQFNLSKFERLGIR
jgi:hypothetical protein